MSFGIFIVRAYSRYLRERYGKKEFAKKFFFIRFINNSPRRTCPALRVSHATFANIPYTKRLTTDDIVQRRE